MKILVIEDYAPTLDSVRQSLHQDGHAVDTASDGEQGFLAAKYNSYDVIILDIMLPKMDGWEVLSRLRRIGNEAQIVMLTAKDTSENIIQGLDAGADDYIVKPFSLDELKARLRACERRRFQKRSPIMSFPHGLSINTSQRSVKVGDTVIKLTPKEYNLLHFFALRQDQVVTRDEIFENVYDSFSSAESNVVDVYVARLRKKITPPEAEPIIVTIRGHGYILKTTLDEVPNA